VASPPLLLLGMVPRKARKGHPRPASWIWSAWLTTLFAALAAVSALPEGKKLTAEGWKIVAPWLGPGLSLVGGLLWGWLAIVNGRLLFPRLGSGIERVRHEALFPLLGAWLRTAGARSVLLLAYAPAVVVAVIAGRLLAFDERTSKILLIPLAGLVCVFWLLSLVDNLTVYLDVKLVEGVAGERNAWHATVRRYFRGYVRRGGVDLAPELVDGLLFLPAGAKNGVTCYGGGFTRPRILIGPDAREAALGPLPDEAEMPERSSNPEELPLGLLLPDLATGRKAGPGWRRDLSERMRKRAALAPARAKAILPRSIGENATLLGWILPTTTEEGLPLISDSSEDFQVVRELLTEHYSGFEKDHRDEEYDDTDPTQKDFLFGPLLREVGRVLRGESLFETVLLAVDVEWKRISIVTRAALAPFVELYQRLLSGGPAMIADAWAGLNGGRDHLLQHLFRERSGNEGYLTTRADTPRLYQRSKEMVLAVAGETPKGPDTQPLRATLRNRILSLGELLYTSLPEREGARRRMVVRSSLAAGALLLLLALGVQQAVTYHPVWVARMNQAEARAAEQKADKASKGEGNGGSGGGTQAQGK